MKYKSDLSGLALRMPEVAAKALRQTANDVVQIAKQLAPVDTGALQRSYQVEPVDETTMIVGSDIEYAPYVEFGTVHQEAQPHFVPAFMQAEETLKARLKQAIENE